MAKAVVFDLDGTLINSEPLYDRSFDRLLKERGLELPKEAHDFHGAGLAATVGKLKQNFPGVADWDAFGKEFGDSFLACTTGAQLFPGARELVEQLSAQMPLGVCSNSLRNTVIAGIKAKGIENYFKVIVARDDVQKAKPDPEPYLKSCQLLGVQPGECAVIEDSVTGLKSAISAGCRTVLFNSNRYPPALSMGADLVVESFWELSPKLIGEI